MKSKSTILLVAGIVGIILVAGGVFFAITSLSQPELPPTNNTGTTPPTTTPPVTTPPVTTPPVTTPPTTTPPTTTPPVVPTTGEIEDGVIVNICGLTPDADGIGETAAGTCGSCENIDGTNASCTVASGKYIAVVACLDKEETECKGEDGVIVETNLTGTIEVADYLDEGCTIQLNVYNNGQSESTGSAPLDYVVFQKEECESTTPGDDDDDEDPVVGKCGDACVEDGDCPTGNICSLDGACVLQACDADSTLCEENDMCKLIEDGEPQDGDPQPGQCGAGCTENSECSNGLTCNTGKCVDPQCLAGTEPTCSNGCKVTAAAKCGDTCTTNADCPGDHTCSTGICKANFCLPDKCKDGCQLPSTAIVSDEVDRILLGVLILIIGLFIIKTDIHVQLFYLLGGRAITAQFSDEEKKLLEKHKKQQAVNEKKKFVADTKKSRAEFEKEVIKKL